MLTCRSRAFLNSLLRVYAHPVFPKVGRVYWKRRKWKLRQVLDNLKLYNRNKKPLCRPPSFSDNLGQTVCMGQSIQPRHSMHYLKKFLKMPCAAARVREPRRPSQQFQLERKFFSFFLPIHKFCRGRKHNVTG